MIIRMPFALALVASSWILPARAAPPADAGACQLVRIAEFPITMADDESPVVDARINGAPVKLLVYSGSTTTITRPGARKLGLNLLTVSGSLVSACGVQMTNVARVDELSIGKFTGKAAFFVAGSQPSDTDDSIVGVLGNEFFDPYDVEFDLPHGTMRLFAPSDCRGDQVVYWNRRSTVVPLIRDKRMGGIIVPVTINGHEIVADISSGSPVTYVSPATAKAAGAMADSAAFEVAEPMKCTERKSIPAHAATFEALSIGDETIRNAKLTVSDLFRVHDAGHTYRQPDMYLGADFLRSHRVYVARRQEKVYFSYEGGPVFRQKLIAAGEPVTP